MESHGKRPQNETGQHPILWNESVSERHRRVAASGNTIVFLPSWLAPGSARCAVLYPRSPLLIQMQRFDSSV